MADVGYHGEMDALSRHELYIKWKSGQVQTIVATKAFVMGIDEPSCHVITRECAFMGIYQRVGRLSM